MAHRSSGDLQSIPKTLFPFFFHFHSEQAAEYQSMSLFGGGFKPPISNQPVNEGILYSAQ